MDGLVLTLVIFGILFVVAVVLSSSGSSSSKGGGYTSSRSVSDYTSKMENTGSSASRKMASRSDDHLRNVRDTIRR